MVLEGPFLAAERLPPLDPRVLVVPASLALVLLLVHSARHRGLAATVTFCALCVAWYVPKEVAIAARALNEHRYTVTMDTVKILGIPLVLPIGYVFTGTVSWALAERITARLPGCKDQLFPVLAVWLLVTSAIAYVMEATGTTGGWWLWEENDGIWRDQTVEHRLATNSGTIHPIIPYAPVYGWALYMLPFATVYLAVSFTRLNAVRLRWFYGLAAMVAYFCLALANGLFAALVALYLAVPLARVPLDTPKRDVGGAGATAALVRWAPQIGVAMMLATSFYVLVVHGRDVSLLQSWLPLAALLAIAHAGRHTLRAATLLFVALLALELAWTPRVHHACVYSGLLVLMSAIRTYREHRSLASLWSAIRAPLTGSSS